MNKVVLDASVILALLKGERIDEGALDLVQGGYMSAVNVAEVFSKLSDLGPSPSEAIEKISDLLERSKRSFHLRTGRRGLPECCGSRPDIWGFRLVTEPAWR